MSLYLQQNNDFCQTKTRMSFSKFFLIGILFGVIISAGCKDSKDEPALLIQRTNQYFNFAENTQWVYNVISDSSISQTATFTLKNKIRSIRNENNSEIISYDLVRDDQYKINVRCEVGPTDYADRIAFLVEDGGQKILSAFVWSQPHHFYAEIGDDLKEIGADTLSGISYQGVWKLKTKRKGAFKEIKFAQGYGLIYICLQDGTMYELKELKK